MTEKHDYQTLGEICSRMRCGERKIKNLIRFESFPAVKIRGQYFTTDAMINEWIIKRFDKQPSR